MSMYQNNMFDRFKCIKPFCFLKTPNTDFLQYMNNNGAHKHKGAYQFQTKNYAMLMSLSNAHFYARYC